MNPLNRRSFIQVVSVSASGAVIQSKESNTLLYQRRLPIQEAYDVIVCGGGPTGCAAALAARREGLKTLLVEAQGQLGGMGTSGLVSHWLGGRIHNGKTWVVGGLFKTMAQEATRSGFALIPTVEDDEKYQPHGWHKGLVNGIPFDPYAMAAYLDEKMLHAGVDTLVLTKVVDVNVHSNRITHVIINNKGGFAAIPVTAVIDATGDADIAAMSGCPTVKGRKEDGLMTPTTLQFHVYNVDQDALSTYIQKHNSPRFRKLIQELRAQGEWPFPYEIFISVQLQEKGVMMINTSRLVGPDGTDGKSLSDGMRRGREETQRLFQIMKKHFPGFQNAMIKCVAPLMGVRETRRIVAETVLTIEDLITGKTFEDTIGLTGYGWDLPDPKKPSYQPLHEKKLKKPPATPIPYRIMTPQNACNLICPGRAVSVERHVLGPMRVMAPCMAMGEATGCAALQVVQNDIAFNEIHTERLRERLIQHGAILEMV